MGLLDKIFKSEREVAKEEIKQVPWNDLNKLDQLEQLEKESYDKHVVILKHSTTCGISRMVLKMFESDYSLGESEDVKLYFLDLKAYRDVSNEVANRFEVRHESPQIIVLKDGAVVHHASHQSISAEKVEQLVK
ncbi:bacillithiol system redox-active protein YtxJ [Christiangramia salexigens]|uniref:Cytosolic protein n=1 Tax=Christiangramia salexigens TaxID=1913577 RepID=A0A1L3J4D5_9FLAO|nr:bacillithiol system redox-active protein YtxJ [Christiangramia salexigens]APG59972.1 cytosolic protein [Christiangramia salexigens]